MQGKFVQKSINVLLVAVFLTGLFLTVTPVQPALAATITVDGTTCTLADAISAANSDTPQGGCPAGSGADTLDLQADVLLGAALPPITSEIVLFGNGHTVDGDEAYQVFNVLSLSILNWDGDLTIQELTVMDGSVSGNGGGILISSGSLTVISSTISGSSGGSGGGIFNNSGTLSISDSILTGNQAVGTGGVGDGGAIYNTGAMTLTNVILTGNQSVDQGGGVFNSGGDVKLENVHISGNQAVYGGGYFNQVNSNTQVVNVEVMANYASMDGGGVYNRGPLTVTNTTIAGNRSLGNGGGVYNNTTEALLQNTIIWNNQDASGIGTQSASISNAGKAPVFRYSDIQGCGGSYSWVTDCGTDGGGNIDANPAFVNPPDPASAPSTVGDVHLQSYSAAINTGENAVCPMSDLDGETRPLGTYCDMGPYEYAGIGFVKNTNYSEVSPGEIFTYTIRVVNASTESLTDNIITDSLPSELNFIGPITLVPSDAGIVGSSPPELVTDLDVGIGEEVIVTFPVSVSLGLEGGTVLTNTARITGSAATLPLTASTEVFVTNVAPVAVDDSGSAYFTYFDTPFTTGNVMDNDYDFNGDTLNVVSFDTSVLSGTLTSNGDGTFDYDPNGQFDFLTVGQEAYDIFSYEISDGELTATATVTITLRGTITLYFPWISKP